MLIRTPDEQSKRTPLDTLRSGSIFKTWVEWDPELPKMHEITELDEADQETFDELKSTLENESQDDADHGNDRADNTWLAWWAIALHGKVAYKFLEMKEGDEIEPEEPKGGGDDEYVKALNSAKHAYNERCEHQAQESKQDKDIFVDVDFDLIERMWFTVINSKFKLYEGKFLEEHENRISEKHSESQQELGGLKKQPQQSLRFDASSPSRRRGSLALSESSNQGTAILMTKVGCCSCR